MEKFILLDFNKGMEKCLGDKDFYLEILAAFVEEDYLKSIEDFYQAEDWAQYRLKTHSLKSASLYVGADGLSEVAHEVELAVKNGDVAYAQAHHGFLVECLVETLEEIKMAVELLRK